MKAFRLPLLISAIAFIATFFFGGLAGLVTVSILSILEISFSFDNAVVNAKILERMSEKWQKLFLTVGILIAVFGMRLVFPLLIVALATHESPLAALAMAIHNPSEYARHLHLAHPAIAGFGGVFLGMLFLDWLFEDREIKWLKPIESFFAKIGKLEKLSVIIMLAVIALAGTLTHSMTVLTAGISGLIAYLIVNSLDAAFDADTAAVAAKAGLGTFIYLEMIDASFSFDGVIGAFAITSNIFLIALGLGIGAMYIRSMTVELVKRKTLAEYIFLEHGAHWAIGILAVFMLLSISLDIPEIVTGLTGVVLIGLAFVHSIFNKRIQT
jgi:hypothetical protein